MLATISIAFKVADFLMLDSIQLKIMFRWETNIIISVLFVIILNIFLSFEKSFIVQVIHVYIVFQLGLNERALHPSIFTSALSFCWAPCDFSFPLLSSRHCHTANGVVNARLWLNIARSQWNLSSGWKNIDVLYVYLGDSSENMFDWKLLRKVLFNSDDALEKKVQYIDY